MSVLEIPGHDPRMPTRIERAGYALGDALTILSDVVSVSIARIDSAFDEAVARRERNSQLVSRFAQLSPAEQEARFALGGPDLDLLDAPEPTDAAQTIDDVMTSIFDAPSLATPTRGHHETPRSLLGLSVRAPREYCRRKQT